MMLERSNVWKYSKDTREKSQKRYSILKELRFYQLGSIMLRRYEDAESGEVLQVLEGHED